jgi:endonuclease
MPIYDRSAKALMADWARQSLTPEKTFEKSEPVEWFARHYPKIKRNTIQLHVDAMSVNSPVRKHHQNVRLNSGHDLFYKIGPNKYRLWSSAMDPAPLYGNDFDTIMQEGDDDVAVIEGDVDIDVSLAASREFAFERDLRNYLSKNLGLIEPGLKLYDDEGITGVEFPVGGRFIDLLAVSQDGCFVVIELKVSRGYDRVVGQLLRYMAWVSENLESVQTVRGVIVANNITPDLVLAASLVPSIRLVEYELSFKLRPV